MEPDLFAYGYPDTAGYRYTDTSQAAAQSVDAKTLQKLVVGALAQYGPMTADETAGKLGRNILSIRPRLSELRAQDRVRDTGERRPNASGRSAAVFALAA
jgi:predicted ArsR family transcriptional regulator